MSQNVTEGDEERNALHYGATQTQGKPDEKRRGPAMAEEVSRVQLHGRERAEAADRPQGHCPFQGADSGTDEPNPRYQPTQDGQRYSDLLARLARLFRRMPNAFGAEKS